MCPGKHLLVIQYFTKSVSELLRSQGTVKCSMQCMCIGKKKKKTKKLHMGVTVKKNKNQTGSGSKAPRKLSKNKRPAKRTQDHASVSNTVPNKPVPGKPPKFASHNGKRYWLIKSEPVSRMESGKDVSFSLEDLVKVTHEPWNGVRNYEARNNLLHMQVGDFCLFYHSNCPIPGIVGVAQVSHEASPDPSQFVAGDPYYDPKSLPDSPKWWCPDVTFYRRFRRKVRLLELKDATNKGGVLKDFGLVHRSRLSVIPVSYEEYKEILKMESMQDIVDDLDCNVPRELIVPQEIQQGS